MSLDDKIAAIMSGNYFAADNTLSRASTMRFTSPSPALSLADSARSSPLQRSNTVGSPATIASPITSPLLRPTATATATATASAPSGDAALAARPPLPPSGNASGYSTRAESPLISLSEQSAKSHNTLESMLSEYRTSKPPSGDSAEASPAPSVRSMSPLASSSRGDDTISTREENPRSAPTGAPLSATSVGPKTSGIAAPLTAVQLATSILSAPAGLASPDSNPARFEAAETRDDDAALLEGHPSETASDVFLLDEAEEPDEAPKALSLKDLVDEGDDAENHGGEEEQEEDGGEEGDGEPVVFVEDADELELACNEASGREQEANEPTDASTSARKVAQSWEILMSDSPSPPKRALKPVANRVAKPPAAPSSQAVTGTPTTTAGKTQAGKPPSASPAAAASSSKSAKEKGRTSSPAKGSSSTHAANSASGGSGSAPKGKSRADSSASTTAASPSPPPPPAHPVPTSKARIVPASNASHAPAESSSRSTTPSKKVTIATPAAKPSPAPSSSGGNHPGSIAGTPAGHKASATKASGPPPVTPHRSTTPARTETSSTPTTASKPAQRAPTRPIKLAVRVRPFSEFEVAQKARRTISKGSAEEELVIVNPKAFDADPDSIASAAKALDNKQWAQSFQFDHCLWDLDTESGENYFVDQEEVHTALGIDIVNNVLNGISCSCFAYGHTSTGKTYSLFGDSPSRTKGASAITAADFPPDLGLVPRVFRDIITAVKVNRVILYGSRLFLSFLEVYNERVLDLLDDTPLDRSHQAGGRASDSLKVREHPSYGPYVEGLKKVEVFSVEDALELVAKCQRRRAFTQTAWNSQSSRSHAVVTLELTNADLAAAATGTLDLSKKDPLKRALALSCSKGKDELDMPIAKVQMVDLAGSEKDSMRDEEELGAFSSAVDATPSKASELADKEKNELRLIRRSLATLGFIIQSLAKGASFKSLPYRDSVLTFLLRDALNGYNHTTMLATVSPAHIHYEETLSTLRYAEKLTLVRRKGLGDLDHSTASVQSELEDEFRAIHQELGKKGSLSAKQMLKYTVSDPRQRIAKLMHSNSGHNLSSAGSSSQMVLSTPKNKSGAHELTFTSPIDGKVKRFTELSGEDLEHLQSSYRNLQSQVIEMQIDLDAIRTDRDSLMVELRTTKDHQAEAEKMRTAAEAKLQSAMRAVKVADKELGEHKLLLKRKDENIERLMAELTEQKQARASAEQAYHTRTKEFLSRFDILKKENKAMEAALELANNRDGIYGTQKLDMITQIEKYRAQVDQLHSSLTTVQEENGRLKDTVMEMEKKLAALEAEHTRLVQMEREHQDTCATAEALRHEVEVVRSERDSMASILKQKDSLLWLQGQQSEMSIKMLQQRQAALERTEAPVVSAEDWQRVSDSLKELFTHEGQVLFAESIDTKKLTSMVRDLREKMSKYEAAQLQVEAERGARKELEKQLVDCVRSLRDHDEQRDSLIRLIASLQQELHEAGKLGYVRRALPANLFHLPSGVAGASAAMQQQNQLLEQQCGQLQTENGYLKTQVEQAQRELEAAKEDVVRAKQAAQKDLGSLWTALQELNKLDALKDKSIQDLVADRVRLTEERDAARAETMALQDQCEEMRRELEEIDNDLMRVASNSHDRPLVTGMPGGGAGIPPSFHSQMQQRKYGEDPPLHSYSTDSHPGHGMGFFSPALPPQSEGNGRMTAGHGNWTGSAPSSRGSSAGPSPASAFSSDFHRNSSGGSGGVASHYPQRTASHGYPSASSRSQHHSGPMEAPDVISEEVLVKQIDQLNTFLTSDGRVRRSTQGSHPAPSMSQQLPHGAQFATPVQNKPQSRSTTPTNIRDNGSIPGKLRMSMGAAPPLPLYEPGGVGSGGMAPRSGMNSSSTKRSR